MSSILSISVHHTDAVLSQPDEFRMPQMATWGARGHNREGELPVLDEISSSPRQFFQPGSLREKERCRGLLSCRVMVGEMPITNSDPEHVLFQIDRTCLGRSSQDPEVSDHCP
jgi:hypothetical protein